jgi:hypothetical protein
MVAMARDERFYQGQIAASAGCEASYVGEFMKRLLAAGLIERMTAEPGQARIYFRKLPSPLWRFCLDLMANLLAEAPSAEVRLLRSLDAPYDSAENDVLAGPDTP